MSARPIGDHALLSDCRSAALVTSDGSVDWLCLPRFDSPAIFARLLDEDAGHWSIRPAGPADTSRRYVEDTLVLETTFRTTTGTAVLRDALALGRRERGHALGTASPGTLLRQITCAEGQVDIEIAYVPRPEFGLVHPLLSAVRARTEHAVRWSRGRRRHRATASCCRTDGHDVRRHGTSSARRTERGASGRR
jgi:GH15 family glucan-1,4-alpha-glucosidase